MIRKARREGGGEDGAFGRSSQTCCGRCGGRRDIAQCGGQTFWGEYSQRRTLGLSFQRHGRDFAVATGGDQRSRRIEAHGDYLLGLIRRQPDITLLEIQGRLIATCGEHFSSSVIWRFFDRHEITFKKRLPTPRSSNARTS